VQAATADETCTRVSALLTRVHCRDTAALEDLWMIVSARVRGWIRSVLGSVDPQDCAQLVLMTLWEKTPKWNSCPEFFGWVKTVSKRFALDSRQISMKELPPERPDSAEPLDKQVQRAMQAEHLFRIGLSIVTAPYQTLCLAANKFLGDTPTEIEGERTRQLELWLEMLTNRFPQETLVTDATKWNRWLIPLRSAMKAEWAAESSLRVGETCLEHYDLPDDRAEAANEITKWVHGARRRLLVALAVDARRSPA